MTKKALLLFAKYASVAPDSPQKAAALAVSGKYGTALKLSSELLRNNRRLSREEIALIADPWMNFHDARLVRSFISGATRVLAEGLSGKLKGLHLFILGSRLRPDADVPLPPVFTGRLSAMNPPAARQLLACGRTEAARAALAITLRNFPRDENACGLMAEALFCSGRENEALDLMARKARGLKSPGFQAWRGQLLLFSGRYEQALRALAPGKGGASPMSGCWRGAALACMGKSAEAMKELREALRAAPEDPEARVWLAETFLRTGHSEKAAAEALKVIGKIPRHPWALLILGLARPRGRRALFARTAAILNSGPAGAGTAWARGLLEKARGCRRHELHFIGPVTGET